MIAIDLSKQKVLNVSPKAMQQLILKSNCKFRLVKTNINVFYL